MIVKTFDDILDDFITQLEKPIGTKVARHINLLEQFGSELRMPYSKSLGNHLFELRIRGQQEVRIFYTFHEDKAVLLHGFIKKTQKTPAREIETAMSKAKVLTSI